MLECITCTMEISSIRQPHLHYLTFEKDIGRKIQPKNLQCSHDCTCELNCVLSYHYGGVISVPFLIIIIKKDFTYSGQWTLYDFTVVINVGKKKVQ